MQKQLANGLILRTLSEGVDSDREQLPQFYAKVNGEGDSEAEQNGIAAWTQDLINDHPLTSLDDIFVVVDPARSDRIASATLLIPQTWRYEEIPIAVGRPELVGTHPEYRAQGLVRALFAAVHERSAALGHQLQGITGIPHFYRQFGYTMAVDLDDHAAFPLQTLAKPAPDYTPSFTLRPATADDIADLARWHDSMARERLLTEVRSPEQWRHEVVGRSPRSMLARDYQIIVNVDGAGVGYVELSGNLYHPRSFYCIAYVVGDQSSYLATFDDVVRGVRQLALAKFGEVPTLLYFMAGMHPALTTLIERSFGGFVRRQSYKWYLRVPDPIVFLRHIQPVLERRLEGSGANRYTGEFKIGFYDLTGIVLKFESGRIVDIAPMRGKDGYDVAFPWHLFWNVVFGDQSVEEIQAILPEVHARGGKGAVLINALFPKKKSWLEGLA
jgi:GNAT superfamily N-acetyltransferase